MLVQAHAPSRSHGIALAVLFLAVIFTPMVKYGNLPPLRADDFVVVVLFLAAWNWSTTRGYGWFWGPGKSIISLLYMLILAMFIISYVIGLEAGRYGFLINDAVYTPASIFRLFMVFVICASARPDARGWNILLWTVVLAGLLEVAILGLQYYDVGGFRELSTGLWGGFEKLVVATEFRGSEVRAPGTLGNANVSGCAVGLMMGAALVALFYGRGLWARLALALPVAVLLFASNVVWTASRACVVSSLGGVVVLASFALFVGQHRVRAAVVSAILVVLVVYFMVNLQDMPVPDRVKEAFRGGTGGGGLVEGMYGRFFIWGERLAALAQQANPLTGFGPSKAAAQTVDNDYIAFYYKVGLIGLAMALIMKTIITLRTFANALRARVTSDLNVAFLLLYMNVVLLLFGFTADIFLNGQLGHIIAMCAGLTCALSVSLREKRDVGLAAQPQSAWPSGASDGLTPAYQEEPLGGA